MSTISCATWPSLKHDGCVHAPTLALSIAEITCFGGMLHLSRAPTAQPCRRLAHTTWSASPARGASASALASP